MMQKQGTTSRARRAQDGPAQSKERTGPRQFPEEVRGELRKVLAGPQEVINSTIVVLIMVTIMTALIFG